MARNQRPDEQSERQALNRRVRAIRRSLLFGGVIGTVAFSAIAGYETNAASQNPAPVPTETQSAVQPTTSSFFANQTISGLTPSPTATATKATTTPTPATAGNVAATESAEADASATKSAKVSAAATETAEAVPTETPTPVEEAPSAPSDDAPAQVRSNSHSSS
jgi:hypothetical protein